MRQQQQLPGLLSHLGIVLKELSCFAEILKLNKLLMDIPKGMATGKKREAT